MPADDEKLTALDQIPTLLTGDLVYVVQGGVSKGMLVTQFIAIARDGLATTSALATTNSNVSSLQAAVSSINATDATQNSQISTLQGNISTINASLASLNSLKAPITDANLLGDPTAPTRLTADNSTHIATTAFVKAVVAAISGGGGSGFVPQRVFRVDSSKATVNADHIFETLLEAWNFAISLGVPFTDSPVEFQIGGGVDHTLTDLSVAADFASGFAFSGRSGARGGSEEIATLFLVGATTPVQIELRDINVAAVTVKGEARVFMANAWIGTLAHSTTAMDLTLEGSRSIINLIQANGIGSGGNAGNGTVRGDVRIATINANGATGDNGVAGAHGTTANGGDGADGGDGTLGMEDGQRGVDGGAGGTADGAIGGNGVQGGNGGTWLIERGVSVAAINLNGGDGGNGAQGGDSGDANGGDGGDGGDGLDDGLGGFLGNGGDGGSGGAGGSAFGGNGGNGANGGDAGSVTVRYGAVAESIVAEGGAGGDHGAGGMAGTADTGAGGAFGVGTVNGNPGGPGLDGFAGNGTDGTDGSVGGTPTNSTVGKGGIVLAFTGGTLDADAFSSHP